MVGNVELEGIMKITDNNGTYNSVKSVNTAIAGAVLPDGEGGMYGGLP
jgi:predicted S18 family serine protease